MPGQDSVLLGVGLQDAVGAFHAAVVLRTARRREELSDLLLEQGLPQFLGDEGRTVVALEDQRGPC
jgi:hypothetical protein